ncbi:MAG: S49 family peptidase [Planctomycetaceae bacterium]|nr:S49 family peptidase [Planctomycetaceae bacterium]
MRRRATWFALLLVGLMAGCKHPVRVVTDSNVRVYGPSPQSLGPLVPMPLPGQAPTSGRKIALVDIDGLLLNQDMTGLYSDGENPVAVFREKLDIISRDPCYAAVVLRINSPGGGVTASDMMRHDLQSFKARTGRPVVACLMDVGAGGAYYLATTADAIVAHPTSLTGGIGVILNLYNLEDAMAQFNIVGVPIKSGDHIDLGTPIKPQSDAAREILQKIAEEFHARFRQGVIADRPQLAGAPPDVFDGRVFTAQQGVELQLVDSVGYLDDAARLAGELGGVPGAPLVMLHRRHDRARSPYDATPNVPLQTTLLPLSMPGFERARLPAFLYLWQPDPTLERTGGR